MLLSRDLGASSIRGQQIVLPACIAQFSLTPSVQLAEAKCLVNGKKQISAARITEETWTLKLTFEKAGWNELGFAFDELPQASTSISIPILKTGRVNSAGEIADADISVGLDVRAYESTPITRFLKLTSSATPVEGEFKLAAGKLIFPIAKAGAVIAYSNTKAYASIETIGQEANFDSFGRLVFTGEVYTTEDSVPMQIVVPELSRVSVPSFSITGSLSALEIEFRASVAAGDRRPFKLYRKQGAT